MSELGNGYLVGHTQCPSCGSDDNLAIYAKENDEGEQILDGYCWGAGCSTYFTPSDLESKEVDTNITGEALDMAKLKSKSQKEPITREEFSNLWKRTTDNVTYRGLRPETLKKFLYRAELNSSGEIACMFYPEFTSDESRSHINGLNGFKSRVLPKNFGWRNLGKTGRSNELSGQHLFRKMTGKYILLVGGENDTAAAYQMLHDAQRDKGYDTIPVVSPTTGEGSAVKQCADNYDFLDQFDWIIVGMDNDSAGEAACKDICDVLPRDKVKVASWSMNDPHKMLENGRERQFVRDFYSAKELENSGIRSSSELMDEVNEVLTAEKITLPHYMHQMETMMRRAFSHNGRVVNILGTTSCGKSTHVNNMAYHWIMHENMKPLIVSLEMTGGEYAVDLLSLHLKKNLDWFEEGDDALNYLEQEEVKTLYSDLFVDESGKERFRIVDDRDGKIDTIVKQIERGVKQYGCNIVIIDVLTDMLRFLPSDEAERHMAWQKNFVKSGVSIVNILHTKKPEKDKDGNQRKTTQYDALGTGSFVQSAHINIVINRDNMSSDPVERNTTYVDMPKCRRGKTGEAGRWVYDVETRQVYDKQDWENINSRPQSV